MSPHTSYAHYRITAKLGEGGMGEVWRATDTLLGRDVAIKILPEAFAHDAGRMVRFQREAQVLASLNHPNIASIYGVEERALVMELVEGATLAERLKGGALREDEALDIARQIAAALEAAHERDIVHRDLKPANIKIQPRGTVKVLDFGLAKTCGTSASASIESTQALSMTGAGAILGTPAYMAPEQAQGKPLDKRADIWAFGVVLYEMLTGKRLFRGESVSDTLAAVLTLEPDWNSVPPRTRRLLRKCLERDPAKRLRDIADFAILLGEEPATKAQAPRRGAAWIALGTLAVLLAALAPIVWRGTRPEPRPLIRFSSDLGPDAVEVWATGMDFALSQDGTRIAYLVQPRGGVRQIATRLLSQAASALVPGTEGATGLFLSPNGEWVGFYADGKMKKTPVQGGPVVTLCDAPNSRGASWGPDGYIVANLTMGAGLSRVPEAGGTPQALTDPAVTDEVTHRWPQVLPGAQSVLFTGHKITTNYDEANLEVLSLKSGKWKVVQQGGYSGRYVPTGHLVYVSRSTLHAVPFDLNALEVRGKPVPLLEDVAGNSATAAGRFETHNGMLVYFSNRQAPAGRQVMWVDAAGRLETIPLAPGRYHSPRLSPDGGKLAVEVERDRRDADIVIYDFRQDSTTRLTFENDNRLPLWTRDGKHLVHAAQSSSGASLRWIGAGRAGESHTLYESRNELQPASFSPDGRLLLFTELTRNSDYHLWIMPLDFTDPDRPKAGKPERMLRSSGMDWQGAISPDGKWVAYSFGGAGRGGVVVRPFPPSLRDESAMWQIGSTGTLWPVWSRNKQELFFAQDGQIMVVEYTTGKDTFTAGKPRPWAAKPVRIRGDIDISPDGRRIVTLGLPDTAREAEKSVRVTVLVNFFDELRRRVPAP